MGAAFINEAQHGRKKHKQDVDVESNRREKSPQWNITFSLVSYLAVSFFPFLSFFLSLHSETPQGDR